jgi:hypothetical protein
MENAGGVFYRRKRRERRVGREEFLDRMDNKDRLNENPRKSQEGYFTGGN